MYTLTEKIAAVIFAVLAVVSICVVSTSAFAEEVKSCDHIIETKTINPVELSEYQECWLDLHRADEMSGTLGGLFYVKVPGAGYVSMPVATLNKEGKEGGRELFYKLIDKKAAEADEAAAKELEARLRKELDGVRFQLTQLYGFAVINGITPEVQEQINDLVFKEADLLAAIHGE